MKYRMLASLVAAGAVALGGGVAEAHNRTFQTSVDFPTQYDVPGSLFGFAGQVSSPNRSCVPDRTVKLFFVYPEDFTALMDIDRTSDNGAWAGLGNPKGALDALVRVTRKNIGGSGHRHICGRASATFEPEPDM